MNREEFNTLIDGFTAERKEIQMSKGQAYSGKDDALDNFKRNAKKNDVSPLVIWNVYFSKHLDAIDSFIRGEYTDTEPIEGRFMDAINYLELGYGLVREGTNRDK